VKKGASSLVTAHEINNNKALEQKVKVETVKYLDEDISEVKFINYTILEMVRTIEATVGRCVVYFFI